VQLETDIEFDVVGCQFKQKDSEIIVLGKLVGEHKPVIKEEEVTEVKPAENNAEPEEEEKKVTVIPVEPIGERKKKKLRLMPTE
jgi:hypothetical protein